MRRRLTYRIRIWRNRSFWSSVHPQQPRSPRLRIIVSLTTSPSRLKQLEPVLRSLTVGQTRPPNEIHLNLPWKFNRGTEEFVLPEFLSRYPVTIFRVDDVGPATKLIPTLARITDPNTWVLTVDDDVRHLPAAIEQLECAAVADSTSAFGYSDYALWRKWKPGTPVDFLAGYGGCLYKRSFFGANFTAYFEQASANRSCYFQDDIVISNYLELQGVRRWRIAPLECNITIMKKRGCLLEQAAGKDALSHGAGSGMNTRDRSLNAIKYLERAGLATQRTSN